MDVEEIYLQPPEGDDSDGYDVSDTEEGDAVKISWTILQAEVAEVRTGLGDIVLEDLLGQQPDDHGLPDELPDELPDLEAETMTAPKRIKRAVRNEYYWEDWSRNIASKDPAIFPEPNYTVFRGLSPKGLYDLFFTSELLDRVAELSNQYAMSKFGLSSSISGEEINIFIGILLLSGYNLVTDYEMYWSISEDCENRLVKSAMSRDRFRTIKRCFHLGSKEDRDGEVPDRYKKVRFLISHIQQQFASLFVHEQNLSHDKAMIKYFGKSGLKQAIRNKPSGLASRRGACAPFLATSSSSTSTRARGWVSARPRTSPLLELLGPPFLTWWTCSQRRKGISPIISLGTISFRP
jgi:hypothetical protein